MQRWKRGWFALFPASQHGVARLEFFDCKEPAGPPGRLGTRRLDKTVVRLADCTSVAPAPAESGPRAGTVAFRLETSGRSYLLAADKQQSEEWVAKLCEIAFPVSGAGGAPLGPGVAAGGGRRAPLPRGFRPPPPVLLPRGALLGPSGRLAGPAGQRLLLAQLPLPFPLWKRSPEHVGVPESRGSPLPSTGVAPWCWGRAVGAGPTAQPLGSPGLPQHWRSVCVPPPRQGGVQDSSGPQVLPSALLHKGRACLPGSTGAPRSLPGRMGCAALGCACQLQVVCAGLGCPVRWLLHSWQPQGPPTRTQVLLSVTCLEHLPAATGCQLAQPRGTGSHSMALFTQMVLAAFVLERALRA